MASNTTALPTTTSKSTGGIIKVKKFLNEGNKITIGLEMPSELKEQIIKNMTGSHANKIDHTAPLVNIAAILDNAISNDGTLIRENKITYNKSVNGFTLSSKTDNYDMVKDLGKYQLARKIQLNGGNSNQRGGKSRRSVRRYKSIRRRRSSRRRN